jgi:hypothetical protein
LLEWFPPPPEGDEIAAHAAAFRVAEAINLFTAERTKKR